MRAFLFTVVVALSATAYGQTLVVTPAGYYALTTNPAGEPVLTKFVTVVDLGKPPATDPTDPPPASPLAKHRAAVTAATAAVADPNKSQTQIALARLYRTVGGLPVQTPEQLQTATSVLFNALNLPQWAAWKTAVDQSLSGFTDLGGARQAWIVVAEVLGG